MRPGTKSSFILYSDEAEGVDHVLRTHAQHDRLAHLHDEFLVGDAVAVVEIEVPLMPRHLNFHGILRHHALNVKKRPAFTEEEHVVGHEQALQE